MALFDVAEQCDAAHDPVVGVDGGTQRQRRDVREVGATPRMIQWSGSMAVRSVSGAMYVRSVRRGA